MKVQCLRLIHFLGEVSLADLFAVARLAVFQTHYIECLFFHGHGTRRLDSPQEFIYSTSGTMRKTLGCP
jgi:hypothetical protein